jgi:hypothetical protein
MSLAEKGMKRSTIKMLIRNKIEDWLKTLPEGLRADISENIIVTGGCIPSMLLGEKINDYDIYFRNKASAVLVAKHYCKRFINEADAKNGVSRSINPEVRLETKKNIKGEEEERVTIWIQSAGAVGTQQEEYQYFEGCSESTASSFIESLSLEETASLAETLKPDKKDKYRPVFLSQNAVTLSDKLQLITRFYGEPEQIHKNFDYVHATCYYDYAKDSLTLPAEALEALLSKTLIYRGSLYPLASVFRTRKFIERGWRITAGQMLKILWQISEIDLNDRDVLQEQLLGVDSTYMLQLIAALRDVQGKVDATYLAKLIDEVFE